MDMQHDQDDYDDGLEAQTPISPEELKASSDVFGVVPQAPKCLVEDDDRYRTRTVDLFST